MIIDIVGHTKHQENLVGILADRWRIYFGTINLEPKYVEDVILAALVLHNMLIKSFHFVDCILEDWEVSKGEWCTIAVTDSFYSLQVPLTSHNQSLYAKSIRQKLIDYFVNAAAVE